MVRVGLVLVLLTCVGCGGPNLQPVKGTVTVDGEAVENVLVTFVPEDGGQTGTGTTDAMGQYELISMAGKGVEPGSYRVSISEVTAVENSSSEDSEMATSSDSSAYGQQAMGASMDEYRKAEQKKAKIPDRYNSSSQLKKQVAEGENVIDFNLSSAEE